MSSLSSNAGAGAGLTTASSVASVNVNPNSLTTPNPNPNPSSAAANGKAAVQYHKIAKHAYCSTDILAPYSTRKKYFTSSAQKQPLPIVLVMGFLDAPIEVLFKYGEIYRTLGFSVFILASVSEDHIFLPMSLVHNDTAQAIFDRAGNSASFLVHLMSNGGVRSLSCLMENYKPRVMCIDALIIDSAPSIFNPFSKVSGKTIFFQEAPVWLKTIIGEYIDWKFYLLKFYYQRYPHNHYFSRQFELVTEGFPSLPRLFLYSNADQIISSKDIEKAIAKTKENTRSITTVNFLTSKHCGHLQAQPQKYVEAIGNFIKESVLKGKYSIETVGRAKL